MDMKEERLKMLISSELDRIMPPPGAKERILRERLSKQDDAPGEESFTTSELAIIEDKRSDITPPVKAEQEQEKEKDLFALPEGGTTKGAAVRQHGRHFYIFAAAAACVAVAILGVFVFGLLNSRNKVQTDSTAANDFKDKIFEDNTSNLYDYLCKDEDDTAGKASHIYMLGDKLLITGSENGTVLLSTDYKELVRTDKKIEGNFLAGELNLAQTNENGERYYSDESIIVTYEYIEDTEVDGKNKIIFRGYDLDTLEEVEDIHTEIETTDYAVNADMISCNVIKDDRLTDVKDFEFENEPKEKYMGFSFVFTLRYYNSSAADESSLYIIKAGAKKAKKLYTMNNDLMKKKGDTLRCAYFIEYAFREMIAPGEYENMYIVYSKTQLNADETSQMYKKTFYVAALSLTSGKLSQSYEIATVDAASATTPFNKWFDTTENDLTFINKTTGVTFGFFISDILDENRENAAWHGNSFRVTDQDWDGEFARYSYGILQGEYYLSSVEYYDGKPFTEELYEKFMEEGRFDENSDNCVYNDPLYSVKEERVYEYTCCTAKTIYDESGKPMETRIYTGYNAFNTPEAGVCYVVDDAAVNISDGNAFLDQKNGIVYTPEGVYKAQMR